MEQPSVQNDAVSTSSSNTKRGLEEQNSDDLLRKASNGCLFNRRRCNHTSIRLGPKSE